MRAHVIETRYATAATGGGLDARSARSSSVEKASGAGTWFQHPHELRLSARLEMDDAAIGATGSGADRGVGARELASHDGAEGAGWRRRHQLRPGLGRAQE